MDVNPQKFLLISIGIAAILVYVPYFVTAYGRLKVGFDPSAPRALFDKLPDYAKRATWAHQNSWEVFSLYVAAALMLYASGKADANSSIIAIVFLVARLLFSIFYIVNIPWLRSPMWLVSIGCVGLLMAKSITG
ncbi:MAG: MAPEG family protein [Pseudanabaenaceae cyanobacterium]